MNHQFYSLDHRLFGLDDATEYDTATPYRYAVGKFVELGERIKQGQPITVISRNGQETTIILHTVADLMAWIARHFKGFDSPVTQRINPW